jgi:flagellar protein FliS
MRTAVRNQYARLGVTTAVDSASPHRLIEMLLEGAMSRIATAKGHMQRGETSAKGEQLGWAISIVGGLRGSLDMKGGGEIAANLDALYDYMERKLLEANLDDNVQALDEVHGLLAQIRDGWSGIRNYAEQRP